MQISPAYVNAFHLHLFFLYSCPPESSLQSMLVVHLKSSLVCIGGMFWCSVEMRVQCDGFHVWKSMLATSNFPIHPTEKHNRKRNFVMVLPEKAGFFFLMETIEIPVMVSIVFLAGQSPCHVPGFSVQLGYFEKASEGLVYSYNVPCLSKVNL